MRITINPTLNLVSMDWEPGESYEYIGPFLMLKGDPVAKQAEQQQATFNSQLMNIFQQQYANQSDVLNYLKGKLQPQIDSGGQGFSPSALAAMRTSATDTISQSAQNAQAAANAAAVRSGGSALPSGVSAMIEGQVGQQQAQAQADAQNTITTNDAQLKNSNYWNAINVLSGNAAQLNPLGYASSATSGGGAVAGLSGAVTAANGPSIGQILGGVVGGVGSSLLGNPAIFGKKG